MYRVYRSFCLDFTFELHSPSLKLARWAMATQEYDLDIRHRSGKSNRVADVLSVPTVNAVHAAWHNGAAGSV